MTRLRGQQRDQTIMIMAVGGGVVPQHCSIPMLIHTHAAPSSCWRLGLLVPRAASRHQHRAMPLQRPLRSCSASWSDDCSVDRVLAMVASARPLRSLLFFLTVLVLLANDALCTWLFVRSFQLQPPDFPGSPSGAGDALKLEQLLGRIALPLVVSVGLLPAILDLLWGRLWPRCVRPTQEYPDLLLAHMFALRATCLGTYLDPLRYPGLTDATAFFWFAGSLALSFILNMLLWQPVCADPAVPSWACWVLGPALRYGSGLLCLWNLECWLWKCFCRPVLVPAVADRIHRPRSV
ncbi:uncharacterized protein BJ171DRAFT_484417 [Polychytrium aggregatum]|uniref:uncharacterized protein n=1 Tax=Polychytrium aggregatum TaxID=110093 RepID=UPI0022FEF50C|nr:uncharacterized protein BJ171DRAFT_484417 [Polychytrium aggregatum]KAI9209563.1 hypothetical protein BJ171DRAFT_484417 [Polychytrium aggregatum]